MGGGAEFTTRATEIMTRPLFKSIAANHQTSTGVIALSWVVQRGVCVIPKSSSLSRIDENIRLVKLTEAEMKEMNDAHVTICKLRIADHNKALRREVDGQQTVLGWTDVDFGWEDAEGNWLT